MMFKKEFENNSLTLFLDEFVKNGQLNSFVSKYVYDHCDVEDVSQGVIENLLKSNFFKSQRVYDSYKQFNFKGFIYITIMNKIKNYYYLKKRQQKIKSILFLDYFSHSYAQKFLYDSSFERLEEKLSLPEGLQDYYDLFISGLSIRKISKLCNFSASWGSVLCSRLKESLGDD